ncbi:hypothetical protein QS257_09355 [Terrilactibacillus sp. S3-3]|nr:hypothetical protein QS257_09355 [Terrilactibacillus sp. S3-3]
MSREKQFVFWIITLVFLLTAGYFVISFLNSKWEENHPMSVGSEKMIKLGKGDYKVGDEIKAGFYDIKAKGTSRFMGRKLTNGDQLLGIEL